MAMDGQIQMTIVLEMPIPARQILIVEVRVMPAMGMMTMMDSSMVRMIASWWRVHLLKGCKAALTVMAIRGLIQQTTALVMPILCKPMATMMGMALRAIQMTQIH
jgi:hypothetical protein